MWTRMMRQISIKPGVMIGWSLSLSMENCTYDTVNNSKFQFSKADILNDVLKRQPSLIKSIDEQGRTPLSYAAQICNLAAVQHILLNFPNSAYKRDNNTNGSFPIHAAAMGGHSEIIGEFLQQCPDTWELLTLKGRQNILHVAATYGKGRTIKCVLERSDGVGAKLVNEGDENGETPLHLATKYWHPMVVSILTLDESVRLDAVNNNGVTALDVARTNIREAPPFRQVRVFFFILEQC